MAKRVLVVLAALLSFALLPQIVFTDAYAKLPIHNADHTLGQFMMLLIVPLGAAIVALGVWAMRARQDQLVSK